MHKGGSVSQSSVSSSDPEHVCPPCKGAGSSQALVLKIVPPYPQLAEHSDHAPQTDHPPCTETILSHV